MEYQSENKICQNCKNNFIIEPDDFSFYEKIKVPPPTFCNLCRAQRRFMFRNERKLFRAKDELTKADIFSLYPTQLGRKVITVEEWNSDKWDALEFSRDYSFEENFFIQFLELLKDVPRKNLNAQMMVDSPYCGNATGLKRCYLCFGCTLTEDSMYCTNSDFSRNCIDCSHIRNSEKCYMSFWLEKCYECHFSVNLKECSNVLLSRDCVSCNNCFGCVNLRNKSNCIFNVQYTKEEYKNKITEMNLGSYYNFTKFLKQVRDFWNTQPVRYQYGVKNLNSFGSYLANSKDVKYSYLIIGGENLKYCQYLQVPTNKDCYDVSIWGNNTQFCYETAVCGENSYNLKFCFDCWPNCQDLEYCTELNNCSDCFGCVGLKNKKYCVFNKQYTKEEYVVLVQKIKEHMTIMPYVDKIGRIYKYGEFFPSDLSLLGYNNTIAMQHFPLKESDAVSLGYKWLDVELTKYEVTMQITDIPDSINDTKEGICEEILSCVSCSKAYKITKDEFSFLHLQGISIPRICGDCRYDLRLKDRHKIKLYSRICDCEGKSSKKGFYSNGVTHTHGEFPCGENFITGYDPKHAEIVYCEKCYQQEVY